MTGIESAAHCSRSFAIEGLQEFNFTG